MKNSVLIVDDSKIERYMLKRQLNSLGFTNILEESDGIDAMSLFEAYDEAKTQFGDDFPPSIIFLDINMPIMGGFEFLNKFANIRNQHNYKNCAVVMYSSSIEDKEETDSFDFVKGFINKNAQDVNVLKDIITNIV